MKIDQKIIFDVIIAATSRNKEYFLNKKWPANIKIHVQPGNYTELMRRADLAVHAAGSTSWELAYLGVSGICYVLTDNQLPVAKAVEKERSGILMGWEKNFSQKKLVQTLESLINEPKRISSMSRQGTRLIDGKGARRVAEVLENEKHN